MQQDPQRLNVVFGHLHEGVLVEDAARRVRLANTAFTELFTPGMSPDDLVGVDCDAAAVQSAPLFRDPEGWLERTRAIVARHQPVTSEPWQLADGRWIERDYYVRLHGHEAYEHIWIYRDVTRQRAAVDAAVELAQATERTGFRDWEVTIDRMARRAEEVGAVQRGSMAAVKVLQMDLVNAELGYAGGDELLVTVLAQLRERFGHDNVERLKGTVFGVVTADADPDRLLRDLHEVLDPTRIEADHFVTLSTAIGVVTTGDITDVRTGRELFELARYAVREGQRHPADLVMDLRLRNKARIAHELESRLPEALESGEFVLHYQPIVRMAGTRTIGYEALVRWEHPVHGLLAPDAFIPVAEELGVVARIDRWVIEQVCRAARDTFPDDATLLGINLSTKSAADGLALVQVLRDCVAEYEVNARRLVVEVTESAVADDLPAFITVMRKFRSVGVSVGIDDFGVGSSTLAALRLLPFNYLKIDRSFVIDLHDARVQDLIRLIVAIGHTFSAEVIAEGVETQDQADLLLRCGVGMGQGWLLGRPALPQP
ncbi:MAG: EAL domain-containing protein [Candidatus Nanopelagicales bacterium]|nr:EAL domain-containing protein [Candidatus Nanopelagicales bacterium]